ncbi:MAG TPA: hypothetical protein VED01_15225 [Burkholderiales bacterium]|nr:hypothetical protein [Burkholderiales bacterium]
MTFSASWAARLVCAFDATGLHRASTRGDYASGEWLTAQAREAGATVSTMPVALPRTIVEDAFVELAGRRIDGLPMFDSPPAPLVEGTLGRCGEDCAIGYLDSAPNAASIKGMSLEKLRRETRHAALVIATRVAGESLAPINAQFFHAPFGPPVLQVAGMHHESLSQLAARRTGAMLVCRHRREAAESLNVVAHTPGPAARRAPDLVVLTPRTGWWESTAERGGGLAAWIAALHTASGLSRERRLGREVHGYATCGHELGHVGLHHLLKTEARLAREAEWLHLGANLGCASSATLTLRASEASDAERMRALLGAEGYPDEAIRVDAIATASGEARDVIEHGGKVLSLIGTNAHFHAASDRWPSNVNAARVAAIARAVSRWIIEKNGGTIEEYP